MTDEQKHIFSLLKIFAELCDKHRLRYFLIGGTLLGAVRHKGFIPWDDDVDVAMPLADYQKFLSFCYELPNNVIIQSKATDKEYPYYFSKLCNIEIPFETKHKTKPPGIYIDIFPLVGAKKPLTRVKILFNLQLIMSYVIQVKLGWQDKIPYKKWYARLIYDFFDLISLKRLLVWQKKILNYIASENTNYYFSLGGPYKADKEFYPKAWFVSDVKILFEGHYFSVPIGWKLYLCRNYGDYMTMPPENERYSRHK